MALQGVGLPPGGAEYPPEPHFPRPRTPVMSTVFQKLNLKDEEEIVVLNSPPSFEVELGRLDGVRVLRRAAEAKKVRFALAFATTQKQVDDATKGLAARADGDIKLWFAYPKQSSKRYTCEFNRDTGWAALGAAGYEPVRMVAIDEDWSAVRFRRAEFIASMKRDPKHALSAEGKKRAGRKG